jgi:predicted PP-loop superfamily ATPase
MTTRCRVRGGWLDGIFHFCGRCLAERVSVAEFVRSLRLPPNAAHKHSEFMAFGHARGLEALQRQIDLAKRLYRCCWEPKDGAHHPACREA